MATEQKSTWNLPPFKEKGARFSATSSTAGIWMLPDSSLHDLGNSLRTDEDQAFKDLQEPIRAIPDPWAQPRTFAEALITGSGHSMYHQTLPQWRGLLATLALSQVYSADYTISVSSFELGEQKLFDRVLGHLTPKFAIGGKDTLWRKPVIFRMQRGRKTLATWLGNPACLVSSGRVTADHMVDSVPWFKAGLKDPLECNLPLTQLVVLEAWLRQLSADLEKFDDPVSNKIGALVNDFADACGLEETNHGFTCEFGGSLFVEEAAPFNLLGKPTSLKAPSEPWKTSQTQIQLTHPEERGGDQQGELSFGNLKGMILADPALASEGSEFDPQNTIIWGTRTLSELIESPAVMEEVVLEAAVHGWAIVTADDIFSDRVAKFGDGASIPGNPMGADQMLLPIRPLAMLLGDRVQDRVTARSGGTSAVFTFTVPLVSSDGTERTIELVRNYSVDPGNKEYLLVEEEGWNVAHASVWPNIKSSAWHEYFVRINYPIAERNDMVRPETGISAQLIAGEIAAQKNGQAAVDSLRLLNERLKFTPNEDLWRLSPRSIDTKHDEIQFSPKPFEAIAYFDALDGKKTPVFAGLAMLQLEPAEPGGGEFNVAVDFGSTNTVACIEDRTPVTFQDRKIHPVVYGNPEMTNRERLTSRWLFKRFFPADQHTTPSPTVALARVADTVDETHPIFRNLIYFHTHAELADEESEQEKKEFQAIRRSAHFNLKWSEDPVVAEAAEDFLRQFMHMVALEALADGRNPGKIRWRFSIPDSLDGELRLNFEDTLIEVTQSISTAVAEQTNILKPLYSEGLAAANLILEAEGFVKGSINLVLDIGGSTTDVTIWDNQRLVWKGSFKLAGRNFFTSTISQNPDLLEPIGLGHWAQYFDTAQQDKKTKDSHLAEMLFSGPALQDAIDRHWSKLRVKTGEHLRLTSLSFIGMLAWYLGRVARKLVEDEVISQDQLNNPVFALCGRGAGLFKKMHAGRAPEMESQVTNILRVFSRAASIEGEPRPQLLTTGVAKMEVVGGMIEDNGRMDMSARTGADDADNFTLSGLGLTLESGEELGANEKFSRSRITQKASKVELSELDEMVKAFEELGGIRLDLKAESQQGVLADIRNKVIEGVNGALEKGDNTDSIEPPFVSASRLIVHALAMSKEDRDRRLKVSGV